MIQENSASLNFLTLFLSGFFSWLILKIIIPYLKIFFNTKPDSRSSHSIEKPSGGGIAFCFVGIIGCFFYGNYLPFYCLPLALIGLLDDKLNLPAITRFICQILTVLYLWKEYFLGGGGSLMSIIINNKNNSIETLDKFIDSLSLFGIVASWGGYESLIMPIFPDRQTTHEWTKYSNSMVRIHIGLEDPVDLIEDLASSLDSLK